MNSTISDIVCSNTRQCSSDDVLRVCYGNVRWTDESNFCNCSSFFGWVGENCDEVSGTVIYFRFALVFDMTWSFIMIVRLAIDTTRLWTHRTLGTSYLPWRMYGKAPGNKSHLLYFVLTAIFFGFFFLFISAVMEFPSLVDPRRFELKEFVHRGRKEELIVIVHDAVISSLRMTVAVLHLIATLLISLTWLSLADSLAFFHFFKTSKTVNFFRKFAKFTTAILLLATFILPTLDLDNVRIILTASCGVVSLILFILGRRTFLKILRDVLSRQNTVIRRQLELVSVSSGYTIVLLPCAIISLMVHFPLLVYFREHTPPGGFSYALVSRQIAIFLGLCLLSAHYWYIKERLKQHLRPQETAFTSENPSYSGAKTSNSTTNDRQAGIKSKKGTPTELASSAELSNMKDTQATRKTLMKSTGTLM